MKLTKFDTSNYLKTDKEMKLYLNEALKGGDSELVLVALKNIIKAKNISQLSRNTGISRESIYKGFSKKGNPSFKNFFNLIKELDLTLSIN